MCHMSLVATNQTEKLFEPKDFFWIEQIEMLHGELWINLL